ncbi:peptidoglycan-binding domain-containing protein [Gemmobacter sp.]|uniref:peptidoglycan-binding domain-containing protein n=1 Tax=Gemmobacter sp. TaxID=1898957 RepID=UPI002AFF6137|nr:peptidoglycan-binding domain-containing protein [Gemmobacter sp.]
MRNFVLPLVLRATVIGAALALPVPGFAQQSFGDTVSGIAQTLLQQQVDRSAFADAQRVNTRSAYQSYLTRFPNGLHRTDAQRALEQMGVINRPDTGPVIPDITDPVRVEGALGLTRLQRLEIQQQLTAIGYDTRGADGLWGANTRNAIARWQAANRLPQTGYVTAAQVKLIAEQSVRVTPTPPRPEPTTGGEQAERALNLSLSERREVQLRLTLLGHSTQGTNGTFGPLTRSAIADWQRKQGVAATGYVTADQIRLLARQTGG